MLDLGTVGAMRLIYDGSRNRCLPFDLPEGDLILFMKVTKSLHKSSPFAAFDFLLANPCSTNANGSFSALFICRHWLNVDFDVPIKFSTLMKMYRRIKTSNQLQ